MKKIFSYGCFMACLLMSHPAFAEVVHSLNQIPNMIKSKEGKSVFASEMNGDEQPDGLGVDFWSSQNKLMPSDVVKLIDSQYKDDEWSLVSMKAWPGQKNRYIVVACSLKKAIENPEDFQKNTCSDFVDPRKKIIVAVLDYDGLTSPKLATVPYQESIVDDDNGNVENFDESRFNKSAFIIKNNGNDNVVGNINRLDFAHYQLNPQTLAFGIRMGANVGYAGGFASTQWVTLFAIINGKVQPVIKVKTYNLANIAGDWHDDGTRDHDITEEEYILSILPHQTNGFYDIKYSPKGFSHKKIKVHHWNDKELYYQ